MSGNGTNDLYCGSLKRPCQTISYVLNFLLKTSSTKRATPNITISVLSNIVETSIITIKRSVSISIEGVGHPKSVLTHVWSDKLFYIEGPGAKFQLYMKNINITMRDMYLYICLTATIANTFANSSN